MGTGEEVADRILEALRSNPDGLTRTQIRDLFGRNMDADRLEQALVLLEQAGYARRVTEQTGGRPAERWFAR